MTPSEYRSEIDGLRGLAVLCVLLFHLKVPGFSGGFVGVDIFFVISGFLITGIISRSFDAGTFKFSNFYGRRVRRLAPALLVTIFTCLIASFFLLSPVHLTQFAKSAVYSLVSASNFLFWNESGYFNIASEYKPLLHTWSLSIEEQFYLIWPVTLIFLLAKLRRHLLPWLLLVVIFLSLALNFYYIESPETIFYLTPFRIFEFAIGALVNWTPHLKGKKIWVKEFNFTLGFILILYATVFFSEATTFPAGNALLPCVGTALIIYAGKTHLTGRFIDNALMIYLGKISYSLYLVHWPLIVFYKYKTREELSSVEQMNLGAIVVVLAIFLYHFVENPIRYSKSNKAFTPSGFGLSCAFIVILLMIPATHMWGDQGWTWRFKDISNIERLYTVDEFSDYVWKNHRKFRGSFSKFSNKPKILILGDSQSGDFTNILVEAGVQYKSELKTKKVNYRCLPLVSQDKTLYENIDKSWRKKCERLHNAVHDLVIADKPDTLVLAASWPDWSIQYLSETIDTLQNMGIEKVFVVGTKYQSVSGLTALRTLPNKFDYQHRIPARDLAKDINKKILSQIGKDIYIDLLAAICDSRGCRSFTDEGRIIFYDRTHLSPSGARFFARELERKALFFPF